MKISFKTYQQTGNERPAIEGVSIPEEWPDSSTVTKPTTEQEYTELEGQGFRVLTPEQMRNYKANLTGHEYFTKQAEQLEQQQADRVAIAVELQRMSSGQQAAAEIAVQMKKAGGVLAQGSGVDGSMFSHLNDLADPVAVALRSGQFQSALNRWRTIFGASSVDLVVIGFRSLPEFSLLDQSISQIIGSRIIEFDGLTQAEIDNI